MVALSLSAFVRPSFGQSPAGTERAGEMQSYCKRIIEGDRGSSGENPTVQFGRTFETGVCWGAFAAIQGAYTVYRASKDGRIGAIGACLPVGGTRVDVIRVFSAYLDKHLDRLGDSFFEVVNDALNETYPRLCK